MNDSKSFLNRSSQRSIRTEPPRPPSEFDRVNINHREKKFSIPISDVNVKTHKSDEEKRKKKKFRLSQIPR